MKPKEPTNRPASTGSTPRIDRFGLKVADVVTRRPLWVIAIVLMLAMIAGSGARFLEFSNNYRVFFSPKNPDLLAFEEFQATYTKNDNILFVLKPKGGEIFTAEVLHAVERLTEEAWTIPFALRVDSITNFQHTWSQDDDLTVEDLVRDAHSLSTTELDEKRAIALAEPLLLDRLISPEADTTGINVTLQYPELSLTEVPETAAFARSLARELEADYPGLTVAVTGVSMLNNAFASSGQQDASTLMPVMFLVLVLFTILSLRSFAGAFATLSVVGLSAFTALGLAGWLGIQLTPIAVTGPVIIMTLAIADSVHILVSMLGFMKHGMEKSQALRESLRINFLAVLVTTVTTIIGFLTLNFSDAPPFHDLGNITAMGIAVAWLYSVTFLPALVTLLPLKVKQQGNTEGLLQRSLERLSGFVVRKHRTLLWVAGPISLILIALVPFVDLDDQWVEYFDHRVEFRGDADFAIEHLNGLYLVELSIPAVEAEGISEPAYLQNLDTLSRWFREQPEVTHVVSYTDVIKRLNKNLHGDDPSFYGIPERRDLAAQYLLLYELSLPFGLDLNDRVNVDKSATRVSLTLANISTVETREFLDRTVDWMNDNLPATMASRPTGASVMFSYISQRNIESMLQGNVLAILLIAGVMILALRSFGIGILSILPNAAPILITLGLWSLLVGRVGMAAATVSASSLGIIVDDSVHFLSKYLRARREQGLDRPEAVRYAFRTVGVAIVVTTVILTAGFLVLSLSTFRINFELGILTSIAIVIALVADFLLLPSLLLWGHKSPQAKENSNEPELARAS